MKDLATDFKTIFKKDRGLFGWMFVQFALSGWLFLLPLLNLDPSKPKVWARYSDINNGYSAGEWYYFVSFSILAITLGIGHILISARLYSKRGKDIARMFLGVSMAITIIAIHFLMSIIGEG
jgi:hypothetical protein